MDSAYENPLHRLDHVSWQRDPLYSTDMKDTLVEVNQLLNSTSADDHKRAYSLLEQAQDTAMAEPQRLRMLHAMGRAAMSIKTNSAADSALYRAIEIALPYASVSPLSDHVAIEAAIACVELAHLHAKTQHWQGHYTDATESLLLVLELLRELPPEARIGMVQSLELQVHKSLADYTFMLGRYNHSMAHLVQAETLLTTSADPIYEKACILWTKALLHQWRGEADHALWLAQEASDIFARLEPQAGVSRDASAQARVDVLVVECACDAAAYFQEGKAFRAYRSIARDYLQEALRLTNEADNLPARGLAALAQTRFKRLTTPIGIARGHKDRVARIDLVIHAAEEAKDLAWMNTAYTEMGREYEAYGDVPSAKRWYSAARDLLDGSEMPALSVWANRGLHRLSPESAG